MHANLMCTPGFKLKCHMRIATVSFQHSIMCDCFSSALNNSHALAIGFVSCDRLVNRSAVLARASNYDCFIAAIRSMCRNLCGKTLMSAVVFGNDKQSAGVFVDAMNNAGTMLAVNAGKAFTAVKHKRIHKRAGPVSDCRMHDHAARFIHHNDILILIDDIERNIFGCKVNLTQLRHNDSKNLSASELVILFDRFSISIYRLLREQILYSRTCQAVYMLGQPAVNTLACVLMRYG